MYQQAPADLEQRLSKLQTQLDRLSLTLQLWQQTQEHLQPMERRLSNLLQQSGEILDRLAATDERHAHAIGEVETKLTAWDTTESRLEHDAVRRLHVLEQTIEQQWTALREQLSRDLQAAIADLRQGREARPPLTGAPGSWPIEGVLRLHDELRQSGDVGAGLPAGQPDPAAADPQEVPPLKPAPQLPEASGALASRVASLERAVSVGQEEITQATDRNERQRKNWVVAFTGLAVGVVVVVALAIGFQRGVTRRLNDAASRVAAAERQAAVATDIANRQVSATRENAERQIAEARQSARQAQTVSDVLAAPDLVRFNLTTGGPSATRSFGQLLWSRSRGLVFSASRMPAAASGSVYQLWLLTGTVPVSAGLLTPDQAGRVTMVADDPPKVPRPVTGVSVTLEPAGGRPAPSGPTLMERLPIAPATPEAEPPASR